MSKYLTIIPAYGRDYKTAKAAKESWDSGCDWIVADAFNPYDGKPINKEQAAEAGYVVNLRFSNLRKTCKA